MAYLRVAAVSLNQTPLDWAGNRDRIIHFLEKCKKNRVQLACFPELCITGYGCEDAFLSPITADKAQESLASILPHTEGIACVLCLPHYHYGAIYNCAVMIQNGRIRGVNAKKHLAREGVHYEPRWFRPWASGKMDETVICGQPTPIGDVFYRFGTVGVGVEICEEAWGPASTTADQADKLEIVLNPSASHFARGKYQLRKQLVADSARGLRVYYVYSNLVGLEAGRIIYDGGNLIALAGKVVANGKRFGFQDGYLTETEADLSLIRVEKIKTRAVKLAASKRAINFIECDNLKTTEAPSTDRIAEKEDATNNLNQPEEFLQAEAVALFDYMRKTNSQGYVISLSGGCDSSAVCVLVAHMIAAAIEELGKSEFSQKIQRPEFADLKKKQIIASLLTCIYQKTNQNSKATEQAAKKVANECHATFLSTDVQQLVDTYVKAAEELLGHKLTWQQDDLTLQNVQARVRAPMAWLIANLKKAVLLTTSNRSEAAVGYATMDGDTAGGLAPIGGIDKAFLISWIKWAADQTSYGLGPIKALKDVSALPPTAELRPRDSLQTDESDLMPYHVLDQIERFFVRDKMSPSQICVRLEARFPELGKETIDLYVQRFMDLWTRNQWKRERLAPAFHVDEESVDPKSWCRYPIISGPMNH